MDFDDATAGPAVIDLVRFGVSLNLAAKSRGWSAEAAVDSFLAGYRTEFTGECAYLGDS